MSEKPKSEGLLDHDFFDEMQCKLLADGLINSFNTKISMHLPNGKKGIVSIKCTEVVPPEEVIGFEVSVPLVDLTEIHAKTNSLIRAANKLADQIIYKRLWFIYAEMGDILNKKYICISILPGVLATYSFQRQHLADYKVNPSNN